MNFNFLLLVVFYVGGGGLRHNLVGHVIHLYPVILVAERLVAVIQGGGVVVGRSVLVPELHCVVRVQPKNRFVGEVFVQPAMSDVVRLFVGTVKVSEEQHQEDSQNNAQHGTNYHTSSMPNGVQIFPVVGCRPVSCVDGCESSERVGGCRGCR